MIELSKDHWGDICQNVTNIAVPIFHIPFNTRLKSEIVSTLFEIESAKYYRKIGIKVKNALNDSEPDLFFTDLEKPVEIKVTKFRGTPKWMGNKISKKESQFVLIVWDEVITNLYDNKVGLKFYVTTTYLTPDNWSGQDDGYEYHASFLSMNNIRERVDLIGNPDILQEYYE
jgi:hypothetical protein